jgi:hypothetical protein
MRSTATTTLLALGTALLVAGIALSFKAGCTGDLKGGALGNPIEALRLQGFAAMAALASTIAFMCAASTLRTRSPSTRLKLAIAAVLITSLVWFTVGWEAEIQGVRQCFAIQ